MAADRMAAVRAARSKPEDFEELTCPTCGTTHRPAKFVKEFACWGKPEAPHRGVILKGGKK